MENILSQFNADNLDIKLTSEKLFINTATSSEAFALRSVVDRQHKVDISVKQN